MTEKNRKLIDATLAYLDIKALNAMQQEAVKAIMEQSGDVVLLSPTGTGKTLAYLLPLLCRLNADVLKVQALVVVPTRELAMQIEQVFRSFKSGMKILCCYGGKPMSAEKKNMEQSPALIVATPGRLLDHIHRNNFSLEAIHTLVLDEFDKSLEMGFQEEMSEILHVLPSIKQRLLTSATDKGDVPEFIKLNSPKRLDFLNNGEQLPELTIRKVLSSGKDKADSLLQLVRNLPPALTLIFCNQRESVERVAQLLDEAGIVNEFFHGGLEQPERERALCRFRNGSSLLFVSTDLASRGLDIPEVKYIIHYHLPLNQEAFTHRNGRTARMNASGEAFILWSRDERMPDFLKIEEYDDFVLNVRARNIPEPQMITIYIGIGKRDKINKVDIVGFLIQKGQVEKSDIGLIEIKESHAYVAVNKHRADALLANIRGEKIKGKKTKFEIAD